MITTYQIRNVLRIYGNQLKKNTLPIKDKADPPKYNNDIVDISVEARSKQMVNKMSDNLISQVTPKGYRQESNNNIINNSQIQNPKDERENYEN